VWTANTVHVGRRDGRVQEGEADESDGLGGGIRYKLGPGRVRGGWTHAINAYRQIYTCCSFMCLILSHINVYVCDCFKHQFDKITVK